MKMIHTTIRFTKNSLIFLSVTVFGLLLTACHGNNNGNEPDPKPEEEPGPKPSVYETVVEIGANILQDVDASKVPHRVHLGPDQTGVAGGVTEIRWTAGDEVACWNAAEGLWSSYSLIGGENTTSARFQGKAVNKEDDEAGVGKPALNINHAIFPLSATVRSDDGKTLVSPGHFVHSIYFTMPSTQMYHEPIDGNPTFGTQYNVMTGTRNESDKNHIFFTSTGGLLLLRIKGSDALKHIYKMKLTSKKEEKLWGTFTAAIGDNGVSTVEVASDINGSALPSGFEGSNSLILDCSGHSELSTTEFTSYYFVVPYGVFSAGFTIDLDTDNDGSCDDGTIKTSKDNTVRQSDMKVMPALELTSTVNLTWDLDDLYNQGTVTEF